MLSAHPARRWTEALYLLYSPLWIGVIAILMATRAFADWRDRGYLALGVGLALPLWIVPLAAPPSSERGLPLAARYTVKASLFIALLSALQNYFGSTMFFDSLGMQYHFPVRLALNGTPLFLYFLTVAYFSTYFALLQIGWRLFRNRFPRARWPVAGAVLVALSYTVAFGETFFMASAALRPWFSYADRGFVLRFGSLCYGTLFVVALPLFVRIDDDPAAPTPLSRVLWEALGANMLILVCYELYRYLLALIRAGATIGS
jgi:cycloeucalenol cycloisomerase